MPIDAKLAEWLTAIQAMMPAIDLRALPPRETAAAMRARQRPPAPEPNPELQIEDLIVPAAVPVPVRLYRPVVPGPLALIVSFHGGGWVVGNVETDDASCRQLALLTGCAVASVDYRLAPEHVFPAASDDCYNATVWMAQNAARLGLDGSRIAVCGSSAGGNLAASVALRARDAGAPALSFQMLIYPVCGAAMDYPSYAENHSVFPLTADDMVWFWEQYVPDPGQRFDPYVSPLRAPSLAGLPPAHIITAELDPLRDEGLAYARALAAADVRTTYSNCEGMVHGFLAIAGHLPQCMAIRRVIADILAAELRI